MVKFLSICGSLALSACASSPHIPIGLPSCDTPIPVTAEIWNDLDLLRETMSHNQLIDEECVEKLRARIRLHDASTR